MSANTPIQKIKFNLEVTHVEKIQAGFYEASGIIKETGARIGNSSTNGVTRKQAVYNLWKYANEMYGPINYPNYD